MLVILASYDQNKKWNLFVFEMGPSLKFDSAIKDAIFNQRNWGKLGKWGKKKWGKFSTKRAWGKFSTKRNAKLFGGGSEGSLANDYKIQSEIQANTNEDFKIYIYNL